MSRPRKSAEEIMARALQQVRISKRPSDALILEAKTRLETSRSLTQEIFGDPHPGYSALDQKKDWPAWY